MLAITFLILSIAAAPLFTLFKQIFLRNAPLYTTNNNNDHNNNGPLQSQTSCRFVVLYPRLTAKFMTFSECREKKISNQHLNSSFDSI